MIARYQHADMAKVWSEENKFQSWLEVECGVVEALGEKGIIPEKSAKKLLVKARKIQFDEKGLREIDRLDQELKHDVLAFTTYCAAFLGEESRYFHYGLTSTDVVDTAAALRIREAGELVKQELHAFLKVLKKRAIEYRNLPCLGRTHGMAAEPTIFGLKFLGYYCEMERSFLRIERALKELEYGKISGAVGASAHFSPAIESKILRKFGLKREPVSTQVLPRDRLANLFAQLAILAAGIERMGVEFRHLQRSEVGEVFEGFSAKQKGSSAMPHKRNPISSENLVGISRVMRSYVSPSLENIVLWHERDISHSSVERVIIPDAFSLIHYSIRRMSQVVANLEVNRAKVTENLTNQGSHVYSGHLLLELVHEGALREEAYRWIQQGSFRAKEKKVDPVEEWKRDPEILKYLNVNKVSKIASPERATENVMHIYDEVLERAIV